MANRIPLIVDTADGNKIKELPSGSNLDLTGSGIVGATNIAANSITAAGTAVLGSVSANNLIVNASTDLGSVDNVTINGGTVGQVLTTDGAGNLAWSTLGNYNQSLNTTDNVQFNFINARRLEAPINVNAEIRTSSTGSGVKTWQFLSTGNLVLPNFSSIIGDVTGNTTGYHTGEVKGSVFGNDSTLLVDGISNKIVGPIDVNIANLNITGGAPNQVLKVGAESLVPEWGYADRLIGQYAFGMFGTPQILYSTVDNQWQINSSIGQWKFKTLSGDLLLPAGTGYTDIKDHQNISLLRGNWGVVNIFKINLAGYWPFNGIGVFALPATTRVWNNSTIILDHDTWEALKEQYPAWVAGDAIPNDLVCLGGPNPGDPFNNAGKIIQPTEFGITTSGGYITDVRVSQAGINQSVVSTDNLMAFLPGDTLTQNTVLPASGILGRIPTLPINYQDSGLTLNQGQLVVNPINQDSTVEPVVAKFYGDVMVTGEVLGDVIGNVMGDVQGSVFANDSTQMINAITGKIVGPIQVNVANISILGGTVNQVLRTDGSGNLSWATQSGGGGGGAVVLDDLTDVVLTSAISGEVLKYNGSNWVNSAVPLNAFGTITVSGSGINITPDQLNDTLTFIASTGISMTADAGTDTITITNTAPNQVQNTFTTIAVSGQTSVAADTSTDTLTLVGSGITITTDSLTDTITFTNAGAGLESRTTVVGVTASLANLASADLSITGFKGYVLYKIQTSVAAWVRLYTDGASRTADAARLEINDPAAGSGVIAEVITTGSQTILMSPAVMGFSNESPTTTTIPCRVTNKSGSNVPVTVTLTLLKIEA